MDTCFYLVRSNRAIPVKRIALFFGCCNIDVCLKFTLACLLDCLAFYLFNQLMLKPTLETLVDCQKDHSDKSAVLPHQLLPRRLQHEGCADEDAHATDPDFAHEMLDEP